MSGTNYYSKQNIPVKIIFEGKLPGLVYYHLHTENGEVDTIYCSSRSFELLRELFNIHH